MGGKALIRRAAGLLAAGVLFAAAATGVSADGGDEEAAAEAALQPTQVVAEIPDGYGDLFPLEWGGGSLLHLKGRLATMGCIADTIWVYDNNQWHPYNQYQVPHTLDIIQSFKNQYSDYIPPTTIYADCTNICEFNNNRCIPFHEMREQNNNYENSSLFIVPLSENDSCTRNFNPKVTTQVLPTLPARPDACIVTKQRISGRGIRGVAPGLPVNTNPFFVVYDESTAYRTPTEHSDILLTSEIHELCHINQNWHWVQQLTHNASIQYKPLTYFYASPHGQTFIHMVGYQRNNGGTWLLPQNSVYRDIYSKEPTELAAELCSMYLLDRMGERSNYDYEKYNYDGVYYEEIPIRNTNLSKYLTPDITEWLETHMILPEIAD